MKNSCIRILAVLLFYNLSIIYIYIY